MNGEEAMIDKYKSLTDAAPAIGRLRSLAISLPRAIRTILLAWDGYTLASAACRLDEVNFKAYLKIAPALLARAPAPLSEEVAEDVAKQVEDGPGVTETRTAQAVEPAIAVALVTLTFLLIVQNVIRLGGFLEFLFRLLIADIAVGMILHGQLAVSAFDFFLVGLFFDPQDVVIVALVR